MKYDLISDLHVDNWRLLEDGRRYPWQEEKKSDLLIIAGDISGGLTEAKEVLKEAGQAYHSILFVDGNHEHYNMSPVPDNCNHLHGFSNMHHMTRDEYLECDDIGIFFMNGTRFCDYWGTLFIGANGWYDFNGNMFLSQSQQQQEWKNYMNDYHLIDFGVGRLPSDYARKDVEILEKLVKMAQDNNDIEEIVVTTHTSPIKQAMVPDDCIEPPGSVNGCFFNSMMHRVWEADVNKKITTWNFGHTHNVYDKVHHGIRFINNSRGYVKENKGFRGFEGIKQIDTKENLETSVWLAD